ncbi:MAG: sulfite exporter TauE/SafE family protein [Burkholderiales bacterium]|nr:sulfite exporter TauE/SafE family protein [Burkholderiales bacterium]
MDAPGILGYLFAGCVLTLAYAIRGTAGFGGQSVAVPLLTLVMPLHTVLATVVVLTALASVPQWMRDWRKIEWREIRRVLPFSIIGVLSGLYLLEQLDLRVIVKAFGVFVIFYGCFAFVTAAHPLRIPERYLYPAGMVLGTFAGALGATFGAAAGPLYVIYLDSRRLARDVFRITITTILTVQGVVRIAGYARLGFFDAATPMLIAAGLPLVLVGGAIGNWLAGRLDQRWFNLGISALLVLSGTVLLLK